MLHRDHVGLRRFVRAGNEAALIGARYLGKLWRKRHDHRDCHYPDCYYAPRMGDNEFSESFEQGALLSCEGKWDICVPLRLSIDVGQ